MSDDRWTLAVGLVAVLVLAGCTAGTGGAPGTTSTTTTDPATGTTTDPTDSTTTTSSDVTYPAHAAYVFDHADTDAAPVVEGGINYGVDGDYRTRYYATVIGSQSEADDRLNRSVLPDGATDFVEATDFQNASLVVVQHFPASSVPDFRVESVRRSGDHLSVAINDSSAYGTADITVETVLLRVGGSTPETVTVTTEEGHTVTADTGVVNITPPSNSTKDAVELPYASDDPAENVDEPRDLRLINQVNDTVGYEVVITHYQTPDCRDAEQSCAGIPSQEVTVFTDASKLRADQNRTFSDLIARKGTYEVTVMAEVPGEGGSRRTTWTNATWTVDGTGGALVVRVEGDGATVTRASGG